MDLGNILLEPLNLYSFSAVPTVCCNYSVVTMYICIYSSTSAISNGDLPTSESRITIVFALQYGRSSALQDPGFNQKIILVITVQCMYSSVFSDVGS